MNIYLSLVKMRFINGLQYRVSALASIATQFGFGFMYISQYLAFYRTNPAAFPMEITQVVSYIWVQQAFLALFMTWFFENDIFSAIIGGHIAYDLARPVDLYGKWYCQCVASRLSRTTLRCLPVLAVGLLLPSPYKLTLPPDAAQFCIFLVSAALSLCVVVAFSMLTYITTFYTMSPTGVRIIGAVLADFMAGSIVPLPFFPDGFRQVAQALPFAAMQNIPLRIFSGNISAAEAPLSLLFQLFWLVILCALGRIWMNRTLKRVVIQGG